MSTITTPGAATAAAPDGPRDPMFVSLRRHALPAIDGSTVGTGLHRTPDGRMVACRRPAFCRECERWLGHSALAGHVSSVEPAGYDPEDVRSGLLGRPYLTELPAEVSLSHTRSSVVTAVYSRGLLLGVDLEDASREVSLDPLPARERAWIEEVPLPAVAPYVCREALGKALGIGLLGRWRLYDLDEVRELEPVPGGRLWEVAFCWFRSLTGLLAVTDAGEVIACVGPSGAADVMRGELSRLAAPAAA